ncbi:MAG: M23 family metallopeptidase [Bacteroidota bacterium]
MNRQIRLIFFLLILAACGNAPEQKTITVPAVEMEKERQALVDTFVFKEEYIAHHFDFPVGKPNAKGYYNAQGFTVNGHLGDDWNAVTGGNTDLGDPIYAIANGYVKFAANFFGGWGNVIRVDHQLPDGQSIESLYAHCDTILVKKGDWVQRGQQIGTIGNVGGLYLAHLHLEVRDSTNMSIGFGYADQVEGYLDPTRFIEEHR